MNILAEELVKRYEEVEPMEFYREIFPLGELDEADSMTKGKYTAIALEFTNNKKVNGKQLIKRYSVTNDLDMIDGLLYSENFCVLSPISYSGKSRKSENARIMYALCVELDNLIVKDGQQEGLERLVTQWTDRVHWIPRPTYTVASGSGLHLYYLFEKGIPLYPNVAKELAKYKTELTKKIWNSHVTISYKKEDIQQESIFQGFRMVGTITKSGDRVHAFRTGELVNLEYMNRFVSEENQITQIYKSNLTLSMAKERYPEWYEKRIEKKEQKGHWTCKRDLYDWWKRRIEVEATVGHRYYCMMMLAIYAVKCDIPREELEKDCIELMKVFEELSDNVTNHFTEKDVLDALQSFEDKGLVTYPVNSIANRSGISIKTTHREKGKRLKQSDHVKIMSMIRDIKYPNGEWRNKEGRPTKEQLIKEYMNAHQQESVTEVARVLNVSRPTIYKYMKGK